MKNLTKQSPTKEEILHSLYSTYATDRDFIVRVNELTYALKTGIMKVDKVKQ